jgi:hypothetical protein
MTILFAGTVLADEQAPTRPRHRRHPRAQAGDDIDRVYVVIQYPLSFGHL